MKDELGRKIQRYRQGKRMAQEELAEASGVSIRTIQRIESGQVRPRPFTLRSILKVLDVSMEEFDANGETALDRDRESTQLNVFFLLHITVLLVPIAYILILRWYWKKSNWSAEKNDIIRRILSFHILLTALSIPILLISPYIVGQVSVGFFPTPLLAYYFLAIFDLLFIALIARRLKEEKLHFLSKIPSLI